MSSSLREFNIQVQNLLPYKSEESQYQLSRSISFLFSAQTIGDYNPDKIENCQFYINLYKIMNILDIESEALWKCVTVLQEASKNIDARHAIVNKFKFFPLLAKILQQLVTHDKIEKILILMQELSYGICILWEEPYLCQLIPVLLREIDSIDGSLAYISLSILVNISYKNFPVICLLMKTTNVTNFSEKIKPFGILANKMLIILEYNNITTTDTIDIYLFIKKSFAEIEYAIKNWNTPLIRHVVEFLIDSKDHNNIHLALIEYENFESDIIGLIKSIKIQLDFNNYNTTDNYNFNKNQQICLGLIFDLFNYIIEIINTNVNLILSQEILQKITDFLYIWLDCKYAGEKAIELFTTVIKLGNNILISNIALEIPIVLKKLMTIAQNNEISNKLITALHKLIIGLLHRTQTTTLVLTNVTEQYFDKIFLPILNVKPELLYYSELTSDELSKYLYCLLVLIEFSNISKTIWRDKMNKMFNCTQIQYILAKGMLIEKESLCNIVFEISKIDNFPQKEVAKFVSQLSELATPTIRRFTQSSSNLHQSETANILCSPIINVSKDCEERLNLLIDKIVKQNSDSRFEPATSELIELFHYKMNMINTKKENLTKKLEKSIEENTDLSHEISLHNSELSKYQNLNFKMHLQHERLETEIKDLNKQKEIYKNGLEKLGKKYREERLKYKNYIKVIETKDAELFSSRKDLSKANDKILEYINDIKDMKLKKEEQDKEIEKSKQHVMLIEKKSKEKEDLMEVNESEIIKLTKNVEELRKSLEKSDNIIKHLEKQILSKNDIIRSYENELNETEEMKQSILNIVENRKSKRKLCVQL